MKTDQIMKRPLDSYSVEQRTKDGMFNATDLLRQWNEGNNQNKTISHYLENAATQEFMKALMNEENFTCRNSVYVVSRARTDRGGGTWMHPLLFIDFAMWLNPTFKVKVLKFVSDQMLSYRNEAGEAYKQLASSMKKICSPQQMQSFMPIIGKGLNYIVTGRHEHQLRNEYGTEETQKQYFMLERQVAILIEDGFLKTPDEVVDYLRAKFQKKYF